ncbi:MAG: sugar ABC transporter ATP-binding protein [Caldimonas sp.]
MNDAAEPVRLDGITVRFGQFTALDAVSLSIRRGEVHALVGENGAGKSTLMKVLAGLLRPVEGRVLVDGRPAEFRKLQSQHVVSMVHQHFQLVDAMTVAENLFLAGAGGSHTAWLLDRKAMARRADDMLERFGLTGKAGLKVRELTIAERQLVEIAKAASRKAPVLVLDEPTASLGHQEADRLFELVRGLQREGVSTVLIAHSIEEVLSVADRITVLRGGRVIDTVERQDVDRDRLVELIVGRALNEAQPHERPDPGAPLLETGPLLATDEGTQVGLVLSAHQVTGIPTHVGADTELLLDQLTGVSPLPGAWSDALKVNGIPLRRAGLPRRVRAGVVLVPGDALQEGVVPQMSVFENLLLPNARRFSRWGVLRRGPALRAVADMMARLDIRAASPLMKAGDLSGGNRQKVVIGKWLLSGAKVLLLNDPTKAVDVGARLQIYKFIDEVATAGATVLLVSSDIDELMRTSDRVLVVQQHRLVAVHQRPFSKDLLMAQVAGSRSSRRAAGLAGKAAVPARGAAH